MRCDLKEWTVYLSAKHVSNASSDELESVNPDHSPGNILFLL